MSDTMQHHHVILIPLDNKLEETRNLLLECAKLTSLKRAEGGPVSWCASYDENKKHFFVDVLFSSQKEADFHHENMGSLLKNSGELLAARPKTVVNYVFSIAP
ncbi:hypothetical protein FM038_009590 [Shewanella eurypsychrophilus]|uniref:ABM domain-containing protein n=1 Tax=Shewanella eurypsychrophilus TaxID=2593656 RepID=A0ABX6V4Z4_9GAMM|nr:MULTISPECIES: hypothetical protein [Shewanella]QFU22383.1 hypothetical protein FS418_11170 [Shewanella sp. YLB-09]QPG57670.1 hypothetical protein FM038_009590 [Shewanella eurypsychrophilus]